MKKIKGFFKRLSTCWLVLKGEITFEQRTVTFTDTFEKVRQLKLKYYSGDQFIQFSITQQDGSLSDDLPEYAMYSNLPYPNFVKSYLPKKLSSNKKLASLLLDKLHPKAKQQLLQKYPELKQ